MTKLVIGHSLSAELLAHEVRALSSAIGLVLDLVLEDDVTAPRETLLKTLKSQAKSLSDVVESILPQRTNTRITSLASLPELVHSAALELDSLAARKGVELSVSVARNVQDVELDTDRLAVARILRNFLVNAIKFTEAGSVHVVLERVTKTVVISVTDTGPGICSAKMAKLFRPYQPGTNEASSSGLGLWMCRELARSIGGLVHVDTKVGVGSCFALLVPLSNSAPQAKQHG